MVIIWVIVHTPCNFKVAAGGDGQGIVLSDSPQDRFQVSGHPEAEEIAVLLGQFQLDKAEAVGKA
jgi:hypothetical protein